MAKMLGYCTSRKRMQIHRQSPTESKPRKRRVTIAGQRLPPSTALTQSPLLEEVQAQNCNEHSSGPARRVFLSERTTQCSQYPKGCSFRAKSGSMRNYQNRLSSSLGERWFRRDELPTFHFRLLFSLIPFCGLHRTMILFDSQPWHPRRIRSSCRGR